MQTDQDRPSAGTETPGEAAGGSVPKHPIRYRWFRAEVWDGVRWVCLGRWATRRQRLIDQIQKQNYEILRKLEHGDVTASGSVHNQQHKLDDEMIEYGLTLKRRMSWVWWLLGFDRL